jgi:D-alanyl-D-alanine endopeptidase (penicillin-binding protein 7)
MRSSQNSSKKKDIALSVLIAAAVAAAGLVPLAWYYRHSPAPQDSVAAAPQPAEVGAAPAPGGTAEAASPAPPPGTEVVPAEESETDRGPASASPAGPTLSFARAAGLHLAPDPLRLNSSVALLMDQGSGEVLVHKNDEAVLPIASLTKLMTALVIAEARQPMDEVLTIAPEDVDNERHSRSRLKVGTTLTRQEALLLALMSSENRAAHALGRAYPGGIEKMVAAMNAKAQQLGMRNTRYVDPTGLSNRNQSTAREVAMLVGHVARNPVLAEFSTKATHLATLGGRTLQYRNSNPLVRDRRDDWAIELQKTGYIVEAGRCLTMLTRMGGHDLVMVLLDADTNRARIKDAESMRRWVVAKWGLPESVAHRPADRPARQVEARTRQDDSGKGKAMVAARDKKKNQDGAAGGRSKKKSEAVAKKSDGKTQTASAKKSSAKSQSTARKSSSKTSVARKSGAKADGRVRETFAGSKTDGNG